MAVQVFRRSPPVWFRIATILLLLWGVAGCYACRQQFRLGAAAMGRPTAYDLALHAALPGWYNWVFALAVGMGFVGAVALIARSVLARPFYAVSIVAVLVQFGWLFAATDIVAHKGASTVLPFPVLIVAIAVFAIWLSGLARRRGWIG